MSKRLGKPNRSAVFTDLGRMEYRQALDLQMGILRSKMMNPDLDDRILFAEHPAVYTLGNRGGKENLIVSKQFLESKNIDFIQTDRGGNITYHGLGQAVLYPIVHLEKNSIRVKDFVYGLEEIMKRTAQKCGVNADRNNLNHGLWVKNAKIGSVGISIKKGVSFHGLALNIHLDLTPFSWINPCGLTNVAVTSIKNEIETQKKHPKFLSGISMRQIKEMFIQNFADIFNYSIK